MVNLELMCVPESTESTVKIIKCHILPREVAWCVYEWRSWCPTSPNPTLHQPSTSLRHIRNFLRKVRTLRRKFRM